MKATYDTLSPVTLYVYYFTEDTHTAQTLALAERFLVGWHAVSYSTVEKTKLRSGHKTHFFLTVIYQ